MIDATMEHRRAECGDDLRMRPSGGGAHAGGVMIMLMDLPGPRRLDWPIVSFSNLD